MQPSLRVEPAAIRALAASTASYERLPSTVAQQRVRISCAVATVKQAQLVDAPARASCLCSDSLFRRYLVHKLRGAPPRRGGLLRLLGLPRGCVVSGGCGGGTLAAATTTGVENDCAQNRTARQPSAPAQPQWLVDAERVPGPASSPDTDSSEVSESVGASFSSSSRMAGCVLWYRAPSKCCTWLICCGVSIIPRPRDGGGGGAREEWRFSPRCIE